MNGFLYTLTLEEPAVANNPGGEPNSANSLYYIPGGLIRGAAIGFYAGDKDAINNDEFREFFLTGETRFLNAYILEDNQRSLPYPVIYKKDKYLEAGGFGVNGDNETFALEEVWQINVHTQRDAELGHAAEGRGAVYRYIALPAGLKLQGAVISSSTDIETIRRSLNGKRVLLGKARTAGYGKALIETADLLPNWRESNQALDEKSSSTFSITLLSPAIVRDANGQPSVDIRTALTAHGFEIESLEKFCKSEIVGGFNRTWGLPLPQVNAISAGSVFIVKTKSEVTSENLSALENSGIGERRAEGFGCVGVSFNIPDPETTITKTKGVKPVVNPVGTIDKNDPTAKSMLARLLRKNLDDLVLTASRIATTEYKGGVSNSQLSRWRVILRDMIGNLTPNDEENNKAILTRLNKFYEDEQKKASSAWKSLEKTRVSFTKDESQRLTEWMKTMFTNMDAFTQYAGESKSLSLGSASMPFDGALKIEYNLRLMDAVMARMAKINTGGKNG